MTQNAQATIRSIPALLEAVPYMLGFTPRDSLVLLGLASGRAATLARLDLAQITGPASLDVALNALARSGAAAAVALTYGTPTDWVELADCLTAHGLVLAEHILVTDGRYRSLECTDLPCCPTEGIPYGPDSEIAAEMTLLGRSRHASREDRAAVLQPDTGVENLLPALHAATQHTDEITDIAWVLTAARRRDRSWTQDETVRLGAALATGFTVRDAAWLAIDNGHVSERDLWLHLARSLPAPYRAAPLFLFAWSAWREGDGAMASIALDQVMAADPDYSAAKLLMHVLIAGVSPADVPALSL